MKRQIDYGDNFPAIGSWDPTVPWRFPKHEIRLKSPSIFHRILPWLMLGLGVVLGVLWMSWYLNVPVLGAGVSTPEKVRPNVSAEQILSVPLQVSPARPAEFTPKSQPKRTRTGLA